MSEETSPGYTVLHLRFKLRVPPNLVLTHASEAAHQIASAKGLMWKIWLVEQDRQEVGGVYLFARREAAVNYLNHPVVVALCSNPAVLATDSQIWDVDGSLSSITRGPLPGSRAEEHELALAGGR